MSMPKERSKIAKQKVHRKPILLSPQVRRLLKGRYLHQLDHVSQGDDSSGGYATEQVENGAHGVVDGLTGVVLRKRPKERHRNDPRLPVALTGGTHHAENNLVPEFPPTSQKAEETAPNAPKPTSGRAGQAPAHTSVSKGRHSTATSRAPAQYPSTDSVPPMRSTTGDIYRPAQIKERVRSTAATVSTRPNVQANIKGKRPIPKLRPVQPHSPSRRAVRTARQATQRHMKQQMMRRVGETAKSAATLVRRGVGAVLKATTALVRSLVGLLGGSLMLIVLVFVITIVAVTSSPFGLFFAAEKNAPGTFSVAEAVATVNRDYNAKLEELQAGDYDSIVVHGQAPDWPEMLAVFAVKLAGADAGGMDVATLDADRVMRLASVFWDMTDVTAEVETINHPGDGEDDPGWTERILHITITAKSSDDMRAIYGFTAYQNNALDELLVARAALSSLAGDLTITNINLAEILKNLPADLSPERRETVRVVLSLVGKVTYFWGGKSHAIGWDSRWGRLQKVWAPGDSTSGTYRPYGLDCSGFVDWVFNNSIGYIIGHGGGVIMQHTYCTDIPIAEAQPSDLAFFPDDSHIGVVVGWSADGGLLVCHCSYSQNNVVVTQFASTGFTAVGRPNVLN